MNEFDLRSYLYNNPLLESEAKLKAAKKKLEKQEAKLDKVDMKDEDAKEKAKHHKDAIKNVKKEIKDLERDLKFDEKAEKKEKKEAMKEGMSNPDMRKYGDMGVDGGAEEERTLDDEARYNPMMTREEMDDEKEGKKMTKEGLKSMIREKITSILNEQEDVDVEKDVDVDVEDEEDIDVDIEKDVEVDDKSEEAEIEVDAEVAGQSADASGLEGLLKKARELAKDQGDDKLVRQISNTIIQHERSMAAGEEEM